MPEQTNPLAEGDNEQTTLSTVMGWIIEDNDIVKTLPLKEGQTGTYHISMKGKTLSITAAALISGQGAFNTQIFDMFSILLPKKDSKWSTFITYIAQNAKDGGLEENTASMAADIIFYQMCTEMDISDDRSVLVDGDEEDTFFRHAPHADETYYAVSSDLMLNKLSDSMIKTTISDLSEAMTAKGYKVKNTFKIKISSKSVRCWYFIPSQVDENRGDESEQF